MYKILQTPVLILKSAFKQIPNFITLLNLFSGSLSVAFISSGQIRVGIIFILVAAVFDFLDGMVARLLKSNTETGKELDSLSDIVSFGFAPSFLVFEHIRLLLLNQTQTPVLLNLDAFSLILVLLPFIFLLFAAIRLARFNLDKSQEKTFSGLPAPGAALLIATSLWVYHNNQSVVMQDFFNNPIYMDLSVVVLSVLMVLPLKFFSLKFSNFAWHENRIRYLFIGISALLLITLQWVALPIIISIYIVFSIISNLKQTN